MATETTYYHFTKPADTDPVDNTPLNNNFDNIDSTLHGKQDALTAAQLAAVNSGIDSDGVADLIELVDSGAKNVLEFTEIGKATAHSSEAVLSNGVRWTLNGDGSITATRESEGAVDSSCGLIIQDGGTYHYPFIDNLCNGEYIFSGCPEGGTPDGDTDGYRIRILSTNPDYQAYRKIDTGNGVELTIPPEGASSIFVSMLVTKNFNGSVTFKPMICSKAAWAISQAYAPYRPSYQELYERIVALEQASNTRSAAKNPGTVIEEEEEQENTEETEKEKVQEDKEEEEEQEEWKK